jgi:hypothetical protein
VFEGFATARIEQLKGGKQVVIGTFKGERTFHDAHKGTSARMIYRGLVEDKGVLAASRCRSAFGFRYGQLSLSRLALLFAGREVER